MVCVSFCVICIVELLVSSVICRFQGLSYLHMPDCIRVFFYFVNSSHYSSYSDFCTKCNILDINLLWNIFFWSRTVWYETIELFILWHVWKCFGVLWVNSYQLAVHSRESCMIEQALLPIGCVIKSTIRAYVVVVQLLTFLNLHFIMEWLLQLYFSWKINLNRHIKHENLLSIYENMDYFQIMLFIVTCSKFQKI